MTPPSITTTQALVSTRMECLLTARPLWLLAGRPVQLGGRRVQGGHRVQIGVAALDELALADEHVGDLDLADLIGLPEELEVPLLRRQDLARVPLHDLPGRFERASGHRDLLLD